jgi:hypothetical protein
MRSGGFKRSVLNLFGAISVSVFLVSCAKDPTVKVAWKGTPQEVVIYGSGNVQARVLALRLPETPNLCVMVDSSEKKRTLPLDRYKNKSLSLNGKVPLFQTSVHDSMSGDLLLWYKPHRPDADGTEDPADLQVIIVREKGIKISK